jgi:hypothetical protein
MNKNKSKSNKVVKDYRYWQLHKVIFEELFWSLDADIRQSIADNPYCKEAKIFEKKLEKVVSERLELTSV